MGGDNIEVGVRVENQGSRLTLGSRLMLVRSVITSSGRATGCLLPWERATPCPVSDGEVHAPSRPRKQLRGATDPPPLTPNRGQEGCVAPWQALQGTNADQCGRPVGSRTELQHCKPSHWNAVTSIASLAFSWDGSCIASKTAAFPSPQTDHNPEFPRKLRVLLQS